jgi:hypothetical protein
MHRLLRHIERCHNARLPGARRPFLIGGAQVGWLLPALAEQLAGFPELRAEPDGIAMTCEQAGALPRIAQALARRGVFRWRAEAFDVRAEPGGPVLAQLDRGALPVFGVMAEGVHVNGLVQRADGLWLWVGRRAADRQLEPDKLDHLVAGGIPSGLSVTEVLVKEAAEEASVPAVLAARAVPVGQIRYAMERPEGLRRDLLHCFDLFLPEDFVPRPADGEVVGFELWPLARVLQRVADTDDFKFNVNLVLIDLFLRTGLIDPASADGVALRRVLDA